MPHSFVKICCIACAAAVAACGGRTSSPKPRGYFRIDLPQERNYTLFDKKGYPYLFEMHGAARITPNASPDAEPFWIDLCYPLYNAKVHISYKDLRRDTLSALIEDVHYLVYKHTIKADAITEQEFVNDSSRTHGFLYDIGGDAASNLQFYLTDHQRHFLRGALYFDVRPNRDSLDPVIRYIGEDIRHLMETLQWRQK